MKKGIAVLNLIFLLVLLVACGGGGGAGAVADSTSGEILNTSFYKEKSGDTFIYSLVTASSSGTTTSTVASTYSTATAIPAKYSYSGSVAGPYVLENDTLDGVISSLSYLSNDDRTIIYDNLTVFEREGSRVVTGEVEPDIVLVGQAYTATESSTLFSSGTGLNVGQRDISYSYKVLGVEGLSLNFGTTETIKISITATWNESNSLEGSFVSNLSGTVWLEKDHGYMVRQELNFNRTANGSSTPVEFSAVYTLSSFTAPSIASKASREKGQSPSQFLIGCYKANP